MTQMLLDTRGVPMESALDARGCNIVRDFIGTLLTLHDKIGRQKIDVGQFLKQYMLNKNGSYGGHQNKKYDRFWTVKKIEQAIDLHKTMEWKDVAKVLGTTKNSVSCAVNDYRCGRRDFY